MITVFIAGGLAGMLLGFGAGVWARWPRRAPCAGCDRFHPAAQCSFCGRHVTPIEIAR